MAWSNEPEHRETAEREPWLRRLSLYLYVAAALGAVWGQVQMLQEHLSSGLTWTLAALIPLALALLGDARLNALGRGALRSAERLARILSGLERRPAAAAPEPRSVGRKAQEAAPLPVPRSKLNFSGWTSWVPDRELAVPKLTLLIGGSLLLLLAQPFLALEKFGWAALLLLPGLGGVAAFFLHRAPRVVLGRLRDWVRTAALGLPGAALAVAGNLLLMKYVAVDWRYEALGILCNTAGLLLLLRLLPRVFADPAPESGNILDALSGEARTRLGAVGKVVLAVAGVALLILSREAGIARVFWQALMFGILGVSALALSFPWSGWARSQPAPQAPLPALAKRVLRVLAFGIGLYLGYRGQSLIVQEQIYPGLYHILAAGIALIVAFREPAPGASDPLREQPLAWYWEAGGLAVLLLVGIWLRTHLLADIPYGIEGDEAGGIVNAREIFQGQKFSIIAHYSSQPVFYLVQLKLSHLLIGLSNWGVKAPTLIYGVLDIVAMYLIGRAFYGPRAGMAVAALLVFSRWQIHFSRFGYGNTMIILWCMLAFFFLVKGLQTRKKWYFVLAGMNLALPLYIDVGPRMLPFIGAGLLLYLAVQQRHFFRRNWQPLLAMMMGVWLTGASIFSLYTKSSPALVGRAKSVSIFSNDPNAPRDLAQGLIASIQGSLTMLNWRGDTRTRHNGGLSGEPMLDFWSALLFALGFAYSLYHWKRLRYFILLIWFGGFMCASIFSIEAPQAHRAFGVLPPALLLAGAFFDRARRLLREAFGRLGVWAGALAFLVLLVPVARTNFQKYFDTIPAFDSNCCEHAKYLESLGPDWEQFIMTAYLWQGHPPFMAFAPNVSGRFFYSAADVVPMYVDTDKNVCYSFVFEYPPLLPTIQAFYPKGTFREVVHPKYGTMFQAWEVKHADLMATRGLTARYSGGGGAVTRRDPDLNLAYSGETWPLAGSGEVSWEGTLLVPHYGRYSFFLTGSGPVEVTIGRHTLASSGAEATATWQLAGGLHRLRARASGLARGGRVRLDWSCPDSSIYPLHKDRHSQAFGKEPVPANFFYTYPEPMGLLETYYLSNLWTGLPQYQQVQPALLFEFMGTPYGLSTPITADWKGWITVPATGEYRFELVQPGYGEVWIDDVLAVKQGVPPQGYTPPAQAASAPRLSAGRHRILVRWAVLYGMSLKLWWTPPGGPRAIVPATVLSPQLE